MWLFEMTANEFQSMGSVRMLCNKYAFRNHPHIPLHYNKSIYWFMRGATMGNGELESNLAKLYAN